MRRAWASLALQYYQFKNLTFNKSFLIPMFLFISPSLQLTIIVCAVVAQLVKNLPAMRESRVRSLGWEDPLEESMATHSRILAWGIPMDRGAWRATVHEVTKSRS